MELRDKRILLGVSGGIAAYKSAELVRRLRDRGAEVRVVMTDSAKYADIILPDLTPQETWTLSTQGENNDTKGIWFGQPTTEPKFERREVYEVCADLAERQSDPDGIACHVRPTQPCRPYPPRPP